MKKITLSLTSIALILLLSACNKEDTEKVSIMLDWYPNAVHSFLYIAKEKGYFEDEGIELDIQFPANPTDPINLAAAGKVTILSARCHNRKIRTEYRHQIRRCSRSFAVESRSVFGRKWNRVTERPGRKNSRLLGNPFERGDTRNNDESRRCRLQQSKYGRCRF